MIKNSWLFRLFFVLFSALIGPIEVWSLYKLGRFLLEMQFSEVYIRRNTKGWKKENNEYEWRYVALSSCLFNLLIGVVRLRQSYCQFGEVTNPSFSHVKNVELFLQFHQKSVDLVSRGCTKILKVFGGALYGQTEARNQGCR